MDIEVGVSIPFIAGQWSLPVLAAAVERGEPVFQSPSLRGSGRFDSARDQIRRKLETFQSPSLRGSGRFK